VNELPQSLSVTPPSGEESSARGQRFQSSNGAREVAILLACARMRLEASDKVRIRELLDLKPDWDRLTSLAIFHRLTSFAYLHLSSLGTDEVPAQTLEFLKARFYQNAGEALRQTGELLKVLNLLNGNGILAVPYKGPELAARVYGNVALRWSCDLDIIVKRQDVPRARSLLEAVGFRPRHSISEAGQQFLVRNRHSDVFHRDGGPVIELHWAFTDGETSFPVGLEDLQPRLQECEMGGSKVKVFPLEDLLLILCVHGATHRWDRLEWLCGVAELIRGIEIDWERVLQQAARHKVEKTLFLGLILAHDLLDAPLPKIVVAQARTDRDVCSLSKFVKDTLARGEIRQPQTQNTLQRDLFRLRLQSTFSDRMRYFFYRFTTPGRREDARHMVPLGKWSVPLPTLFRPFHVVGKVIRGSFSQWTSNDRSQRKQ